MPITQQTPRPWRAHDLPSEVTAHDRTVWVVRIEPTVSETDATPLRDDYKNAKIARTLAAAGDVLWVAWSRTYIEVVTELPVMFNERDVRRLVAGWMPEGSFALRFDVTSEPASWDTALPSVERAARATLGGRHQCVKLGCICGSRGTRWLRRSRTERGGLLGAGAVR